MTKLRFTSLSTHPYLRIAFCTAFLSSAPMFAQTAAKPAPVYAPVHAPNAQALVLKVAAPHKEAKLVGLHMTLPTSGDNVIVACTDLTRIGKPSSKGDMAIMDTKTPVVRRKDKDGVYDVQVPLNDAQGELIGMMVELVPTDAVASEDAALKAVEELRDEIQRGIPNRTWVFAGTDNR